MIRPLAASDLAAVARLDAELFGADGWAEPAWRELLAGPGRRAWVAAGSEPGAGLDGPVAGYALSGTSHDLAELLRIAVRPGVRRRGVAQRLLEEVLAVARADGAERVLLEVAETNAAALALYRRHGFVEIDRRPRYYRDDSAALVLERMGP